MTQPIMCDCPVALLLLLLCPLLLPSGAQRREHASELRAVKGQLFVHMLHSAYFFPQTVEVKWSASSRGRPSLPHWLHLFPSRHRSIAFLLGTPISPHSHFHIHVIARRMDTFESAEQSFSIVANDDLRFNGSTQQVAEIRIENVDAEELIWAAVRGEKLAKGLERAIHSTFRGRGVSPYVYDILPGMPSPPPDVLHQLGHKVKMGAVVQIGTQTHFHPNVLQLGRGIQLNPQFCIQNRLIPMDRHFRAQDLTVDWCKFFMRNMTLLKELEELEAKKGAANSKKAAKAPWEREEEEEGLVLGVATGGVEAVERIERDGQRPVPPVYYIWESVLVFPLLAVFCLLFILCLSLIFFGRREGQSWRDYKTPKDQLDEYLNLRESQRHLREMSAQRQMMAMSRSGREPSDALSIGTFLRPREEDTMTGSQQQQYPDQQQLMIRPRPEFASKGTLASGTRSSIGKQTVAEAARANGSSLHLYRHPPIDSDEEQ